MKMLRNSFLLTTLGLGILARPLPAQEAAPCSPTAVNQETSVRPGINESYLKTDLDVATWVERFEREGREIYDMRHEIMARAGIQPGMAVADIGTGTGLFVPLFSEAVGPGGEVYAVDIVPAFLQKIHERIEEAGWHNVGTVLCSQRSVMLPEDSIDLAFLCDVYHHLEYPRSTMATLYRALRPGGALVLVEFKRIPGESSDWVLDHVRAGQEVFTAEIEAAGFEQTREINFLKSNYMVQFKSKKPGLPFPNPGASRLQTAPKAPER